MGMGAFEGYLERVYRLLRMFKTRIEKVFGADAKPYLDRLAKIQ